MLLDFSSIVDMLYKAATHPDGILREPPVSAKLSPRAKGVVRCFKSEDFGCYTEAVRKLASAVLGERLPAPPPAKQKPEFYFFGALLVPLDKPNSHNYPIGEPFMVVSNESNGHLFFSEGRLAVGNNIFGSPLLRGALPEEIEVFFEKLRAPNVNRELLLESLSGAVLVELSQRCEPTT